MSEREEHGGVTIVEQEATGFKHGRAASKRHRDGHGFFSTFTVLREPVKGRGYARGWVWMDIASLTLGVRHVAKWRIPERVWQARVGAEVKCRGRRRKGDWEEGK
jgi:hypothetical protein